MERNLIKSNSERKFTRRDVPRPPYVILCITIIEARVNITPPPPPPQYPAWNPEYQETLTGMLHTHKEGVPSLSSFSRSLEVHGLQPEWDYDKKGL